MSAGFCSGERCSASVFALRPSAAGTSVTVTAAHGPYLLRLAQSQEERTAAYRLRFEVFNLELQEGLDTAYAIGQDVDEIYSVLADIISWHVRGTRFGIKVDASGLLACGEPGVQLTWMDAKIGDWVVTPRRGKPVEIQALWYNALCIMGELAERIGDDTARKRYSNMAAVTKWSFNRLLWNENGGYLYDVVNGGSPDASIRPNQIFAVSLPHTVLSPERARQVVATVQQHLLTPYGLRSLAPTDPQYRGRYEGDGVSRDSAYHQGTVWPWLMGPFITAYIKVHAGAGSARQQAEKWLAPLQEHLSDAGLGHVSEIFDGNAPQRPAGCIAQAWSVAEILRALVEDIRAIKPGRALATGNRAVAEFTQEMTAV